MTPEIFRKRPVEIEAVQVTVDNIGRVCAWSSADGVFISEDDEPYIVIPTLEGGMTAKPGDWIIKEPFPTSDRRFYPCKPDIFEQTYERPEPDYLVAE